jgi:integrase
MPKIDQRVGLTDRKLQSLKPAADGQRYQVMDSEVPGFGVRVTDRGVRTFIYRTRFPGSDSPARRELGKYPAMTLAEAREKARTWRTLVQQGTDPGLVEERARVHRERINAFTFDGVAEDWFADRTRKQRSGISVERQVREYFVAPWARRPITEITDLDILTIINAKRRNTPVMARQLLSHAKRLFAWVVDQRIYGLKVNPCLGLNPKSLIGKKVARQRVLSDDELIALWRNVKRMPYPFGPIYQLLTLTALRLNEAAEATKTEINFREGIWTIPAARMKGRNEEARPHAVPLTVEIRAIFESLPIFKAGSHLFSSTFGTTSVWMTSKVKDRLDEGMLRTLRALARQRGEDVAAVELPPWTNHDIRRTVRTRLSRLRVPEEAREAILAHVRPGIKAVYDTHDYLDEKREGLEMWAAKLREITDPKPSNVIKLRKRATKGT